MNSIKCARCGMAGWAAAAACKRCGAALNQVVAAPSYSSAAPGQWARPAHAQSEGGVVNACIHCGAEFGVKRWDSWNGFLVECPHCGRLHGKRWNIKRVLFASFLFNAFSFLFTMRPAKALPTFAAFAAFGAAVNLFLFDNESVHDTVELAGAVIFGLGPMVVNGVVLVMHERGLDGDAPLRP